MKNKMGDYSRNIKKSLMETFEVFENFKILDFTIELYVPEIKAAIQTDDAMTFEDELIVEKHLNCVFFKYNKEDDVFAIIGRIFLFIKKRNFMVGKLFEIGVELNCKNKELKNKIVQILPYRNIDPKISHLEHHYVLIKHNNSTNEYIFIRGQERHIKNKLSSLNNFKIMITQTKTPNPIDLINCLKEKIKNLNEEKYGPHVLALKTSKEFKELSYSEKRLKMNKIKATHSRIVHFMNKIYLLDYSENDFIKLIKSIENEKFDI